MTPTPLGGSMVIKLHSLAALDALVVGGGVAINQGASIGRTRTMNVDTSPPANESQLAINVRWTFEAPR